MNGERAKRKAALMKKMEGLVEKLLEWEEGRERPTLSEIEAEILTIREQVGREMLGEVIKHQGAERAMPGPICAGCGQEMRYKGEKGKQVASLVGGVTIERSYYHCPGCGAGIFPPG